VPSGLKIITTAVLSIVGLIAAAIVGMRDLNRRPQYCAKCHITAENVATWVSSDYSAFTHAQFAVSCQRCHERGVAQQVREVVSTITGNYETPPKAEFKSDECVRCHGDYSRLAQLTDRLPRNPHDSPHGEQDCLECHSVHGPSVDRCAECHDRTVMGAGWIAPQ
jgi:nitrate/TMAO reductase-like tetraheme cytochrome c subunit